MDVPLFKATGFGMFSTNLLNQILNTFEAVNSALERRAGPTNMKTIRATDKKATDIDVIKNRIRLILEEQNNNFSNAYCHL